MKFSLRREWSGLSVLTSAKYLQFQPWVPSRCARGFPIAGEEYLLLKSMRTSASLHCDVLRSFMP